MSNQLHPHLQIAEDPAALNAQVAEAIVRCSAEAIAARGRFTLVLSGGSTPKSLYALMATDAWRNKFEWAKIHLFWGDERCVPPDHPDSNYAMVQRELLSKVSISEDNVHRVVTEQGTPAQAAAAYEQTIRRSMKAQPPTVPLFDLVLLGLGTNGHTASLFPHTPVLHEHERLVAECYVDEVKSFRITMTVPLLNAARNIWFLLAGAEKAEVLKQVLQGPQQPEELPAQLIKPSSGSLVWMVDKAAVASLSK